MKKLLRYYLNHVLCYSLLLSLSIFGLLYIILVWLSPTHYVLLGEPNTTIRIIETIFFIVLIYWSIQEIIKGIDKANKRGKHGE